MSFEIIPCTLMSFLGEAGRRPRPKRGGRGGETRLKDKKLFSPSAAGARRSTALASPVRPHACRISKAKGFKTHWPSINQPPAWLRCSLALKCSPIHQAIFEIDGVGFVERGGCVGRRQREILTQHPLTRQLAAGLGKCSRI